MAVFIKYWPNGDALTLTTGVGGISVVSDNNGTGSDRDMTIQVQTTNPGEKVAKSVLVRQLKQGVDTRGYWVHKDTNAVTHFGLEDPSIEDGIMSYPSWMPNCSEVKLPSGVTGFKTYNWVFEELGNMEITYTGFVFSKETLLTGNDILIGVDLSNTSITSIGINCFNGCSSLTSITLPEGVTSLGGGCFNGCLSLTSITLPEGVTSLGDACFSGCASITSITLPESVTSLGDACFSGCASLILATVLPATPPTLGGAAFANAHTSFNIKVRSPYVTAYKTATNWTEYASKISAI